MRTRAAAVTFAAALLLGGLLQLASTLYYDLANLSRRADDLRRADVAARIAARMLPGSDRALALAGRIAATRGEPEFLLASYREVLADAPADAYRWTELARSLAAAGRFGAEYDLAVQRALALAPWSPAVHAVFADLGWRHRPRLSEAQRAMLLPSLRAVVRVRDLRDHLLKAVVRERRHPAFCAIWSEPLRLQPWCLSIEAELARCERLPSLPRRQQRWCREVEAVP